MQFTQNKANIVAAFLLTGALPASYFLAMPVILRNNTENEAWGAGEAQEEAGERMMARRLPWCETEEDYEAVMADLAAQDARWP